MESRTSSAPLLSRIKSWQLVGLGISGWIALYSVAILTWGAGSNLIGNTQGGCFAITMTLAGLEARRLKKKDSSPADSLQWISGITTEEVNQTIVQFVKRQAFRVEKSHQSEASMGFAVRAVKAGRTFVFETSRWKEPVIYLPHAKTTEENRKKVLADLAIIVGAGKADDDVKIFVENHSVQLLIETDFKKMMNERPANKKLETSQTQSGSSNKSG